jgi:hypothetical protein
MKKGTKAIKDKKLVEAIDKMLGVKQQTFIVKSTREITKIYNVKAMDEKEAIDKIRKGLIGVFHGVEDTGKLRDFTTYDTIDEDNIWALSRRGKNGH